MKGYGHKRNHHDEQRRSSKADQHRRHRRVTKHADRQQVKVEIAQRQQAGQEDRKDM